MFPTSLWQPKYRSIVKFCSLRNIKDVRSEVLTTVLMKIQISWDMMMCKLVDSHKNFKTDAASTFRSVKEEWSIPGLPQKRTSNLSNTKLQ
jgi:hypothetical protein